MLTLLFGLSLITLALLGIGLQKTYYQLPAKELKRLARAGDVFAAGLYRAAAYESSLRLLLWIYIGLTSAGGLVLVSRSLPAPIAFLVALGIIWYGFVWVHSGRVTHLTMRLAVAVTPGLSWLLQRLHPLLARIMEFIGRHRHISLHTGLYERNDLLALLERQKESEGSRISPDELDLVMHALTFGELRVEQIMVPQRIVASVDGDDVIGPILLDELHDSGHSRFPVFDATSAGIVGMLLLRDAVAAKHGGRVGDVMRKTVYYVHEEHSLYQVLHAFLTTRQHLFIVVNSFEEYVGIITIDDIIEQVIGRPIHDEFDAYDDMRAVAASQAEIEHAARTPVPDTIVEAETANL